MIRKNKLLILFLFVILFASSSSATAYAAQSAKLYVSNAAESSLSVIDEATHNIITHIPVGDQPRRIVKNGKYIYVSNMYGHSISIIDSTNNTVIDTIPVGNIYPERIFLSNDGKRLYTGDPFLTDVAVIDTDNNLVSKVLSGFKDPQTSIENPSGTRLYVINQNDSDSIGYVSVLDTNSYSVLATIPVSANPMTMAITPDGSKVYVGNNGGASKGNTISVIDTNTNKVIKNITVGINPYDIAINTSGNRLYVLNTFYWDNQSGSTISVINTSTDTVVTTIPIGGDAISITISDDGSKLYATKDNSGTVDVVSTVTNTVIDTIPVGDHPWGVAESLQDNNDLSVPILKQISEPWQSNVYDSADKWSPLAPTINRWGCALTSAAMILQYYGINRLPDNTPLDPGTLNSWLKGQPDGYVGNGEINWLAISKLSKLAKDSGHNPGFTHDALEFSWSNGYHPDVLTSDLQIGQPDILEEAGHFIVAKGINGSTFSINDPFYNRLLLTDSYNNSFLSLRRYTPAFSDLSYIMLVTDQSIDVSLKDNNGNQVGQIVNEQSITDPVTTLSNGSPLKIVLMKKPDTGNYKIVVKGPNNHLYNINAYIYDKDGGVRMTDLQGIVGSNQSTINLGYNKDQVSSSSLTKVITYQTTRDDITTLQLVGQITKDSTAKKLLRLIDQAEDAERKGMLDQKAKRLDAFQSEVQTDKGNDILSDATTILLQDISTLKSQ